MQQLNLPAASLNIQDRSGKLYVFDLFRKRYVMLTPEEWVRQHFLRYLHEHKAYPAGLIAVEASLKYNRMARRADAIIYGSSGKPLMIIECKAAHIPISQDVFDQVARYNFPFGVAFLVVTNGLQHFCMLRDAASQEWVALNEIPPFQDINKDNPESLLHQLVNPGQNTSEK